MKRELQAFPAANIPEEQQRFALWRHEYNHLRPHEALNGKAPAKIYHKSERVFNSKVTFEYPPDFDLRKVSANGDFNWKMSPVRIAKAMAGKYIGLEDCGEPYLNVWFCDFCLGTLTKKTKNFSPSEALRRKNLGRRIIN